MQPVAARVGQSLRHPTGNGHDCAVLLHTRFPGTSRHALTHSSLAAGAILPRAEVPGYPGSSACVHLAQAACMHVLLVALLH